jgi:hypothetical protein
MQPTGSWAVSPRGRARELMGEGFAALGEAVENRLRRAIRISFH